MILSTRLWCALAALGVVLSFALGSPLTAAAQTAVPTAPSATATATATGPAMPPGHGSVAPSKVGPKSADTAELPTGVIETLLLDPEGNPISGVEVKLGVLQSSIEQGDKRSEKTALSNPSGQAVFSGLSTTTDFSYRVTVQVGPAQFGSSPVNLRRDMGRREVLTLYPVTHDQKETQVVGRGVIAVHPRDDVFVIDVLYQLLNIGKAAWVPDNLILKLPQGWTAFTAQETVGDRAFQSAGDVGAKLLGTFSPGSHEVGFRFHLPNPHEASFSTVFPLFPRTIEMRVIVDAAPQMTLNVPGYGDAVPDRMRTGQRVLVAERSYLERRETSPETLTVSIGGMRTKGNGHRVALGIALIVAAYGLWNGWKAPKKAGGVLQLPSTDRNQARELLLTELVLLERAREQKVIGTKAYDQTRQTLVTSLARLESTADSN